MSEQGPEMDVWLRRFRLFVLAFILGAGLGLTYWQPVSPEELLEWAMGIELDPWTVVALVALQVLLHAFALPGSLMLWVFAPLFEPVAATVLLTTGSVLGALAAYALVGWAGVDWKPGLRTDRVIAVLARRPDFTIQVILRVLPGFPHSVLNYGAGVLGLSLGGFLAAATLGLAVKWFVYAKAVHALVAAGVEGEPMGLQTLAPIIVLVVLLTIGAIFRRWLDRHR